MLTAHERQIIQEWNDFISKVPPSLEDVRAALAQVTEKFNANPPQVGAVHEKVPLRESLTADVLVPKGSGPHPVMVYIHGGAWIMGSSRTHSKLARQFAEAGYVTINLDYRLAPENPFPAGIDDCIFAAKWAAQNVARYGGDSRRIAIGGDSAGGNLAAAALIALSSDPSGPRCRAGVLIYGVFDFPAMLERIRSTPAEGMIPLYLGGQYPSVIRDPKVSPIYGVRPAALPPSFIVCGSGDDLLPQSKAMADALRNAKIPNELHIMDEMPHAFMQMSELRACGEGMRRAIDFLRRYV